MSIRDPLEAKVHDALEKSGIWYVAGDEHNSARLDFYLPEKNIYIEIKRFHTPRVTDQLSRADNIILLQGEKAVDLFCIALKMGFEG